MELKIEGLNKSYALGKAKGDANWQVCIKTGSSFYTNDGTSKRLGDLIKDMGRYRHFREARWFVSETEYKVNDRIFFEDEHGAAKRMYIVDIGSKVEGGFKYIVAI
jgi:hypothetical protein